MTKLILSLLNYSLSIFDEKNKIKYQEKLLKLEEKYDKENVKTRPDRNVLDTIERDIMRIGQLVDSEIKRQKASNM